jgi:hypothetical protein
MGAVTREAELEPHGPAAAFVLTDGEVALVGDGAKTFPVLVTAGEYTFRGRLARRGGDNLIGLSRAVREAGELEIGATYTVTVALDIAPREVEVPDALAAALGDRRAAFDARSYTQRKEMARSVAEAKQGETRDRRIARILAQLD